MSYHAIRVLIGQTGYAAFAASLVVWAWSGVWQYAVTGAGILFILALVAGALRESE